MDMSNATSAGPSYGILDVLFGQSGGEAPAEGEEFAPLMALIKAAKEKSQAQETFGRTEEEIEAGKSGMEYSVIGMPGVFLNQTQLAAFTAQEIPNTEQKVIDTSSGSTKPIQAKLESVSKEEVNQKLTRAGLDQLSAEELELLKKVNVEIDKTNTGLKERNFDTKVAESKSLVDTQVSIEPTVDLAAKGVEKRNQPVQSKGSEATKNEKLVPNDRFISTQAYVEMREKFGQNRTSEPVSNQDVKEVSIGAPQRAETPVILDSGNEKSEDFLAKSELPEMEQIDKAKPKNLDSAIFANSLDRVIGADSASVKDVFLDQSKPEVHSKVLLGEVSQGVSFQAVKGGGEMRLVIHPEALGELKLKVGTKNGKVEVQVTAENEEVARMLKGGTSDLENSLRDQNLILAKFDVSVASDSALTSTDTKNSFSDLFNGRDSGSNFASANDSREGRSEKWGQENFTRQDERPTYREQPARANPKTVHAFAKASPTVDGSRRLDVVA